MNVEGHVFRYNAIEDFVRKYHIIRVIVLGCQIREQCSNFKLNS